MKTKHLTYLGKVTLACLGLFMASCSNESFDEIPPEVSEEAPVLVTKYLEGQEVQVEEREDGMLLWGDAIFLPEQLQSTKIDTPEHLEPGIVDAKLGLASGVRKWPNNTVIYVLDGNLTSAQRQVTFDAIEEWSTKTNIRFKERTNQEYSILDLL